MRDSSAFYEAEINLMPEFNKKIKSKKYYKSISLMNIEAKQIYKKYQKPNSGNISKNNTHDQVGSIPGMQVWPTVEFDHFNSTFTVQYNTICFFGLKINVALNMQC